jgi:hypothetical protein
VALDPHKLLGVPGGLRVHPAATGRSPATLAASYRQTCVTTEPDLGWFAE